MVDGKPLIDRQHPHDLFMQLAAVWRRKDTVGGFTIGGMRDVVRRKGFEGGFGAAMTFYAVPESLKSSYGEHPLSFQVLFRLRPPAGSLGRMWNMRMSQPMLGHTMSHEM